MRQRLESKSRADLFLESTCSESPLLAFEDVEVVVCSVTTSMALCTKRRTKDDQVLSDAGCKARGSLSALGAFLTRRRGWSRTVNNVHGTHSTTGVVEDPFFLSRDGVAVSLPQRRDNLVNSSSGVVGMQFQGPLGKLVHGCRIKDIKAILTTIERPSA